MLGANDGPKKSPKCMWQCYQETESLRCLGLGQRVANPLELFVVGRMPRFSMGNASPKAVARPTATAPFVSLRDLVASPHPPVTSISTKGRVVYKFGTASKYPCDKFILSGESSDDADAPRVLCKLNNPLPNPVKLDDMVAIGSAECRLTWKRNGAIPESVAAGQLADVELSLNFGGGKRKRGGAECLGKIVG